MSGWLCHPVVIQPEPETTPAETAFQRGTAALTRGTYDQAIADFTEVLRLTPNRVEAYHNRGEAYRLKGTTTRRWPIIPRP